MPLSLRELYEAALALPHAARGAFLDAHCDDAALRARVERMLAREPADGDDALPLPPAAALADAFDAGIDTQWLTPGARIGGFELVEVLGGGGSSIVFRAQRLLDGVRQEVALKVLRRGLRSEDDRRRFRDERRALAQLQHPGIARLIEGGIAEPGVPYIALELVDGLPIVDYANEHHLDLRARLRVFIEACGAVEAAHRALIVHRDLKPSNVLVSADGAVKLLDFGIAKLLDVGDDTRTLHVALTPAYAAPEQFTGGVITTATDVYALGVLLDELVTGMRREPGDTRPPSARISATTGRERLPAAPHTTRRQLRGDLDNIVLKATADEPARRYGSAGALADDIERLIDGRPVSAHPPTRWYRTRKFVLRHKGGVASSAAFLLAILAALGVALWQANVAREQARAAQEQSRRATAVRDFLVDVFNANTSEQADQAKARNTTAQELLARGARKIEAALGDAPDDKTRLLDELAWMHFDLGLDDDAMRLFREAIDVAQHAHGAHALEAFESRLGLANALHSASKDDAQKAVLDEAAASLDANRDDDASRRGRLYGLYADYYATRDRTLALEYGRRAVARLETVPLTREIDLPSVLARKARAESRNGLDADAIASFQRAIAISRRLSGNDNAEIVRFLAEVAQMESLHGDIAQAERDGREALRIARAIHGEDHIDVVQCEFRLADTLALTGRLHEALDLYADAKRKALALLGPDDGFHVPAVLSSYALALIHAGRLDEGLANIDAAIANRRRNRPGTVPLADYLEIAALGHIETGDFARAKAELDEAATIHAKAGLKLPNGNVESLLRTRAQLALAQGDVADAERTMASLPIDAAAAPAPANLRTPLLRAEVALAADHAAQARTLAADVRARIDASDARDLLRPFSAWASFIEGEAALQGGDAKAAVARLDAALSEWRSELDPESPRIAMTELALARAQLALGDRASAIASSDAAAAIELRQSQLGPQYREPLERIRTLLAHSR